MNRGTALMLFEIYKLQEKYQRDIYPEEIRTNNICPASRIPDLLEDLKSTYSIEESNNQGANVYHVTNIGMAHMQSYLDIKRELNRN